MKQKKWLSFALVLGKVSSLMIRLSLSECLGGFNESSHFHHLGVNPINFLTHHEKFTKPQKMINWKNNACNWRTFSLGDLIYNISPNFYLTPNLAFERHQNIFHMGIRWHINVMEQVIQNASKIKRVNFFVTSHGDIMCVYIAWIDM